MILHLRTLAKATGWEFLTFIFGVMVLWLYFKSFPDALFVSVIIMVIKIVGLYIWERLWKKVKFNKDIEWH